MSNYSQASDDLTFPNRLFDRQRPLHDVLGGGKVADVLLWKDKRVSAAILLVFTAIWFLFEVVEYNLISFTCHVAIGGMLILFIWASGAGFADWTPPDLKTITLPESTFMWLFAKINWLLRSLYYMSSGKDPKGFFLAIAFLWTLSTVASYFSSLNVMYIGLLLVVTLPALYERYQDEVDHLATIGIRDVKRLYKKFDSQILNKIPRGPVKGKKRF